MRPLAARLTALPLMALVAAHLFAAEYNPARTRPGVNDAPPVQRVIVKFRSSGQISAQRATGGGETLTPANAALRMQALAERTHVAVQSVRAISPSLHVMRVRPHTPGESMDAVLARVRADQDVEYAVLDRRVYAHTVPSDPRATGQWYLQDAQPSGINAYAAWDTTTGSNDVVIGVIDTGVLFDHPDLRALSDGGRLLPGYDFVSADEDDTFTHANDGDGRDSDASDPGDWVETADTCGPASDSSWHGTRVSGIIGAISNNGVGIAGVTWKGRILPVRVLGKCGGFNSDVLAGMRWAAGLHVEGVPDNPTPAKILNVSLGSEGPCDSASADVTRELASMGVLIVASAGNEGGPVDAPANCPGVAGIAGLRHAGTKVGYSSLGREIALSAPAGNCVNVDGGPCLFSIDTTWNTGTTSPGANTYTDQSHPNFGTSFSAPIVSGIAALMLAVNSHLTADSLIARLKEGAKKPFPKTSDTGTPPVCHVPLGPNDFQLSECSCTTDTCGAGMANALGSVMAALRPIAKISVEGTVTPGSTITLEGSDSAAADNQTISTYTWLRSGNTISSAPSTSLVVPTSGTITACLTVTDDAGRQDTAKVVISPTSAISTSVAPGANPCAVDVSVVATDASASESGDTGTFTFTRTGDLSGELVVTIAISGTARNGTDYQTLGTSVTFAAGAATTTLTLTPIDDTVASGSKTVTVAIQNGDGYAVGSPNSATITIADNDAAAASHMGGGGGGGGALDALTLIALAFATMMTLASATPRSERLRSVRGAAKPSAR